MRSRRLAWIVLLTLGIGFMASGCLHANDTVIVPQRTACVPGIDCVSVLGLVKTPGQIRYTSGLTVAAAIALAGGPTSPAVGVEVRGSDQAIVRRDAYRRRPAKSTSIMLDPAQSTIRTDAKEYAAGPVIEVPPPTIRVSDAYPLKPGDSVYVYQRLF